MERWIRYVLLTLVACTAGDDVADGTRGLCAEGGALNACPEMARTPQAACWRLVDCGALPLADLGNMYGGDWDNCVRYIEGMPEIAQQLVISCVAASTCDQLKYDTDRCFDFGDL